MKSISLVKELNIPVIGLIENMGGYICKRCGNEEPLFSGGSVKEMSAIMDIPYLGKIPFDPLISVALDKGSSFLSEAKDSHYAKAIAEIGEKVAEFLGGER
jgi:Flp pilus assembly CpaE family ATPase